MRSPRHLRTLLNAFLLFYAPKMLEGVRSPRPFTKSVVCLLGAAAGVTAVAFGLMHWGALNDTDKRAGNRVCTGVGEVRSLPLDAGSTVELTTNSCVDVFVLTAKREVHLLQGEALFTVRHDDRKPFVVVTPHVSVEDFGTQFRIYEHGDQTDVGVLQGEVAIRALWMSRAASGQPVRLGPGEGATVVSTPTAVTIQREKLPRQALERALAWRQGALEFYEDPLRHAVSELNRYSTQKLVVDPAIEHRLLTGHFRCSDFDATVKSITNLLGIRSSVDESDPNITRLSAAQSGVEGHPKRDKPQQRAAPQ
jgi:transmembrane sensor